jgi:hypothetical protein
VKTVESRIPRWGDGDGWTVSPVPTVSVGVLTGPEEYQLVEVADAVRQSDGDLVVADVGARTVRLYDASGGFIKNLGGPGSGPGEFQAPDRVLVREGDSVDVWDGTTYRITRFDPKGELNGVHTFELGAIAKALEPPLYPGTAEPLADGSILVRLIEKSVEKTSDQIHGGASGRFRKRSGALTVSADLSMVDTLMFFRDVEQVTVDAPWGELSLTPPLARSTTIAARGNPPRICVGEQEIREIVCFEPGGSRTVLRWEDHPPPPSEEEMAAWREGNIRALAPKLGEIAVRRVLEQVPAPTSRPEYGRIALDAGGNLWVELGPSVQGDPPSVEHLVFDPAGVLLGTVSLPPVRVMEIGDDYLLGVHQDEYNVEALRLYEIRKQ